MKFSPSTIHMLFVTAASISVACADPAAVDDSNTKPVKETVEKFNKKAQKDDVAASDSASDEDAGNKADKKEKKAKKNKSDDESFADKSAKRIKSGTFVENETDENPHNRKAAKDKLANAKKFSAAERKEIAEGITSAYKEAEMAQQQADSAMSVAQTAQMQADNAYTHCLSQLCEGIQKGAFNIKDGETNDQIAKKADEIETIKAIIADMEKTKARMIQSGTKAMDTVAMSKLILEELEGRIAIALDGEAVVADDQKAALEAELSIARSQAEALGMNLDMAKKAVTALKKNKLSTEKKAAEVADLTSKKEEADNKIAELEEKIKALPKVEPKTVDISELSDQLRKERQKLSKAENAQKTLKDKLEKIQGEIDGNLEKIAPLEDDLREFVTQSAVELLGGKDTKTAKKLKGDMDAKKGKKAKDDAKPSEEDDKKEAE